MNYARRVIVVKHHRRPSIVVFEAGYVTVHVTIRHADKRGRRADCTSMLLPRNPGFGFASFDEWPAGGFSEARRAEPELTVTGPKNCACSTLTRDAPVEDTTVSVPLALLRFRSRSRAPV